MNAVATHFDAIAHYWRKDTYRDALEKAGFVNEADNKAEANL